MDNDMAEYYENKARERAITSKYVDKTGLNDGHSIEEDVIFLIKYSGNINLKLNEMLEKYARLRRRQNGVIEKIKLMKKEFSKNEKDPIYHCNHCGKTGKIDEEFWHGNWSNGTEMSCKKCRSEDIECITDVDAGKICDQIIRWMKQLTRDVNED